MRYILKIKLAFLQARINRAERFKRSLPALRRERDAVELEIFIRED